MNRPLRILQFGLGPIGLHTGRVVIDKAPTGLLELVGAVDVDETKAGRDLGELLGIDRATGVIVSADAERALADTQPDVVLHTTSSFLDRIVDQLELCIRAGAHVVSSTEELAFPFDRHRDVAAHVDALARQHDVTVVGTGVNPGYAMDTLALAATAPCVDVRSVRVERVVDASGRRLPLQRKVGAGITAEEFDERKATGLFGHIGLVESLRLVAAGLGWQLDDVEETLDAIYADREVQTPFLTVAAGRVAGIHHAVRGRSGGRDVLSLDLKMYVGAPDSSDTVAVEGDPPIRLVVDRGIFGDTATVALLVNTAGLIREAPRGLVTMADLPVPRAFATRPGT